MQRLINLQSALLLTVYASGALGLPCYSAELTCATSAIRAFFVLDCKTLVREAVDPIVAFNSEGSPSAHVHAIAGGDGFSGDLTYEKTQQSTCTTCPVSEDLSNYWGQFMMCYAHRGRFMRIRARFADPPSVRSARPILPSQNQGLHRDRPTLFRYM